MHGAQIAAGEERWASIEDLNLRRKQPERSRLIESRAEQWEGKVGMIMFSNPSDWQQLITDYYRLPIAPGVTPSAK